MDFQQALTWIVTGIGIIGFLLVGRKVWWSWYVNLACQAIWYTYAIVSEQPAFLVAASFYTGVFGLNAYKWTKEHLKERKLLRLMNETESGTFAMPGGVTVTYENLGKK